MPETDVPQVMVARLLRELRQETWPARLNTAERAGIDLVMLDADIAGCVTSWLSNEGLLDARRRAALHRRFCDLEQVLPELDEADNLRLWQVWYQMVRLIISDTAPSD
ncbi:hypothetical protein ABT247_09640 [Kitasatospora sp. NPDC001539]|uniref:hypothetical protein n=1 Tax=Kitasatospora sp. NPDC001539 TaxID=3154384 RepID=UPI003318D76F